LFASLVTFTHELAHVAVPAGHLHEPATHIVPPPQVMPQVPQLALSLLVSTHEAVNVQYVGVAALHVCPQVVPSHDAEPPGGTGHGVHDIGPHEAVDVSLAQKPPQGCCPDGHLQAPTEHVVPPVHWLPHPPQLATSLEKSAHPPSHAL
jgi:hypothetical protein